MHTPQFLAYLFISCFERLHPTQHTVARLKSDILVPQNKFGLAALLYGDAARQLLLITVRHVLYCVKRSRGESVAILPFPQVRKIHWEIASVTNVHE